MATIRPIAQRAERGIRDRSWHYTCNALRSAARYYGADIWRVEQMWREFNRKSNGHLPIWWDSNPENLDNYVARLAALVRFAYEHGDASV